MFYFSHGVYIVMTVFTNIMPHAQHLKTANIYLWSLYSTWIIYEPVPFQEEQEAARRIVHKDNKSNSTTPTKTKEQPKVPYTLHCACARVILRPTYSRST